MGLVFLGPPGSGKGTIANILCKNSNLDHFSMGDVFREISYSGTDFGKKIQGILDRGELVDDKLVMTAVAQYVKTQLEDKIIHGFIFDGIPRTLNQAQKLDEVIKIEKVFLFVIPREQLLVRLSNRLVCQSCNLTYNVKSNAPKIAMECDGCKSILIKRNDDDMSVVDQRLKNYEKYSVDIIEYYKKQGKLEEIDATPQATTVVTKLLSYDKLFSR